MEKQIHDFYNQFSPDVSALAQRLHDVATSVMPSDINQWVEQGHKLVVFGREKNMKNQVIYIKPLKDSVNLGFFYGTSLRDPDRLLKGTGKSLRHIKFKKSTEINHGAIRYLVTEAINEHNNRHGFHQ